MKRLAVAGFGMMQVMMFAVAVYSADLAHEIMDPTLLKFFRTVSLLVTTPVVFYAGAPIFAAAWRNLQTRTLGMDVPVAIALALAYGASLYNALWAGAGEVYFDSVTMFIFFLTLARSVQMLVRHRTIGLSDALSRQLPDHAHRIGPDETSDLPVAALRPGDLVLVRRGEILPADGELLDAEAHIDEAMLTGEAVPVARRAGDRVAAGTLNVGNPVQVRVLATATGTTLSHIVSLLQHAQAQKPTMAAIGRRCRDAISALRAARRRLDLREVARPRSSRAFAATLAVLVVACPCAFAIATPAAISAATANLARQGMLVTRIDALESLARIDRVVFDKTGTLTQGDIAIRRCVPLGRLAEPECRNLAAALEVASEHPLARAFRRPGDARHRRGSSQRPRRRHGGRSTDVAIASAPRISSRGCAARRLARDASASGTVVVLGDEQEALARFELHDEARASASSAVASLAQLQVTSQIMSGDSEAAVETLAFQCGIQQYRAAVPPSRNWLTCSRCRPSVIAWRWSAMASTTRRC